ncbi:hypothetical protein LSTR_LSTR009536, partial [Laodelphax striatellus]
MESKIVRPFKKHFAMACTLFYRRLAVRTYSDDDNGRSILTQTQHELCCVRIEEILPQTASHGFQIELLQILAG